MRHHRTLRTDPDAFQPRPILPQIGMPRTDSLPDCFHFLAPPATPTARSLCHAPSGRPQPYRQVNPFRLLLQRCLPLGLALMAALANAQSPPQVRDLDRTTSVRELLKHDDFEVDKLLDAIKAPTFQQALGNLDIPTTADLASILQETPERKRVPLETNQKLERINDRLTSALGTGDIKGAVAAASEALEVRNTLLGLTHWETQWSARIVQTLRYLEKQTPRAWEDYLETLKLQKQVFQLWKEGKSGAALPIAKRCLRLSLITLGEGEDSATALLNVGAQYAKLGDLNHATRFFCAALVMQHRVFPHGHSRIADTTSSIAAVLEETGKHPLATELFNRITVRELMRLQPSGMERISATMLFVEKCPSGSAPKRGDLDCLTRFAKEAEVLFQEPHPVQAELYYMLGSLQGSIPAKRVEAMATLKRAETAYRALGPRSLREQGIVTNEIGMLFMQTSEPIRAISCFNSATDLFKEALKEHAEQQKSVTSRLVKCLLNLEQARISCADPEGALRAATEAKEFAERGDGVETSLQIEITKRLCTIALLMGNDEECNLHASNLLRRMEAHGGRNSEGFASAANAVGVALDYQGRFLDAEKLLREAIGTLQRLVAMPNTLVSERTSQKELLSAVLHNLAACLKDQGRLLEAEQCARESLQIITAIHPATDRQVLLELLNLGRILFAKGAIGDAKALLLAGTAACEAESKDLISLELAEIYNTLSKIEIAAGNLKSAGKYFDLYMNGVVMLTGRSGNSTLYNLDTSAFYTASAIRDPEHGEKVWLRKAADTRFPVEALKARLRAADCMARQGSIEKLREASAQFELALRECEAFYGEDHAETLRCRVRLAETHLRLGNVPGALPELEAALSEMEEMRTRIRGSELDRGLFGETLYLHRASIDLAAAHLLSETKDISRAFGALERGTARAMMDVLFSQFDSPDPIGMADLPPETTEMRNAIEAERLARAELDSIVRSPTNEPASTPIETLHNRKLSAQRLASVRVRVEGASARVRDLLGGKLADVKPRSLTQVQAGLRPGDVVLTSHVNETYWVTIALSASQVASNVVPLTDRQNMELRETLKNLRKASAKPYKSTTAVGGEIQNLLDAWLSPDIRKVLRGADCLIIADSRVFSGCPAEVLFDMSHATDLLKNKVVAYAPSGSSYVRLLERRKEIGSPVSLLAVGDPDFGDAKLRANTPKNGATIVDVTENGPARRAGIRRGDVIMTIGFVPVSAVSDVIPLVKRARLAEGNTVKMGLWRKGSERQVAVELAQGELLGITLGPVSLAPYIAELGVGEEETLAGVSHMDRLRLFGGVLDPVPVTGAQAHSIARLFGNSATILSGKNATVSRVEESVNGKRYILLGTHGLTGTPDRPYDACIALAQPSKATAEDTGFLTLERVLRTWSSKLSGCDMVVLSACSTQSGQVVGDSMMALPVGFMRAGARSVVASLWEVDGVATAVLMKRMFENLLGSHRDDRSVCGRTFASGSSMPKALALTEAKQWMRSLKPEQAAAAAADATGLSQPELKIVKLGGPAATSSQSGPTADRFDFSQPYYWAAFVLVGDPE